MVAGLAFDAYKPEEWGRVINEALRKNAVGLSVANTRFRGEITGLGDTVHAVTPGSLTAGAYTAYSPVSFEQPSPSTMAITVDQADYTAVDVDDIDVVQSRADLASVHAREAAYSLTDKQDAFVFKAYAAAGSGIWSDHDNPFVGTALNLYTAVLECAKYLDTQNAPQRGRWLALSPVHASNLHANPQFTIGIPPGERTFGVPGAGFVGHCAGFAVYSTNNLTTLSGVLKVMAGHRSAMSFAGPKTTARIERREARFSAAIKALSIYGLKVTQGNALTTLHVKV